MVSIIRLEGGHSPDIICLLPLDKITSFLTDTSHPVLCLLLGPLPLVFHCAMAFASCLSSIPLCSSAVLRIYPLHLENKFFYFSLHIWDYSHLSSPLPFHPWFPQTVLTRLPATFLLLAVPHLSWRAVPKSGRRIQTEAFSSKWSRRMISHILHMALLFHTSPYDINFFLSGMKWLAFGWWHMVVHRSFKSLSTLFAQPVIPTNM